MCARGWTVHRQNQAGCLQGTVYDITIEAGGFEWLVQTITGHEQGKEVGIKLAASNIQIMAKPESEDEEAVSDE